MKTHLKWVIPLIIFILLAPLTPWLDMTISTYFYKDGHFSHAPLWNFFYHYGTWPAWFLVFLSFILLIASFFYNPLKQFRKDALLFLLPLALGGGLIVNGIFKQFWPRPRPVQVIDFGGFLPYHPFWQPLKEQAFEPSRSFPCGHCTMGFIFFALCFIAMRRKNRALFLFALVLTLALGIGLSLARLAQGGHFLSDILASLLIIWFSLLFIDHLINS